MGWFVFLKVTQFVKPPPRASGSRRRVRAEILAFSASTCPKPLAIALIRTQDPTIPRGRAKARKKTWRPEPLTAVVRAHEHGGVRRRSPRGGRERKIRIVGEIRSLRNFISSIEDFCKENVYFHF